MANERRTTRSSTFRWVSRNVVLPEPDMAGIGFLSFEIKPLMSNWMPLQMKKKMDRRVKKMQKFIVLTADLSREMEVLAAVEQNLRRNTTIFSFAGGGGKSFNYRGTAVVFRA
ncbi:hypothetical protein SDJN03_20662, partial [Cucurbita argyrosperma subsp. sororia]